MMRKISFKIIKSMFFIYIFICKMFINNALMKINVFLTNE